MAGRYIRKTDHAYRPWTVQEVAWLRNAYGLLPPSVISAVLDRPITAIVSMAGYLGIRARANQEAYIRRAREVTT